MITEEYKLKIFKKFRFKTRAKDRNDLGDRAPADIEVAKQALTERDMPPIEELGEGSNYQQFFSEGVSDSLRTQALRKLFHLPKYNVTDGLDDYTEDYHRFESLGNIVTADLRHQLQREQRGETTQQEITQNEGTVKEPDKPPEQQA